MPINSLEVKTLLFYCLYLTAMNKWHEYAIKHYKLSLIELEGNL